MLVSTIVFVVLAIGLFAIIWMVFKPIVKELNENYKPAINTQKREPEINKDTHQKPHKKNQSLS